jgi:FkbM family methyltransferase
MKRLRSILRTALEKRGYWAVSKSVLPFGIDYLWDIRRVAETHEVPIQCFFDIGAHEGQTASAALSQFPKARVYSFEPHPISFSHLTGLSSQRFHANRLAVSDRTGSAMLYEYDAPHPGHAAQMNSLVARAQFAAAVGCCAKEIEVGCTTVDDFCSEHGITSIDVLKIDTEGHELAVLNGAMQILSSGAVRFAFLEYNSILPIASASGGALAPLAAVLEPLGFKLVATYPVYMMQKPLFASFNALFFLPDDRKQSALKWRSSA